jgi:Ca-activated chloride channel homolog
MKTTTRLGLASLLALSLIAAAWSRRPPQEAKAAASRSTDDSQVTVPSRPGTPLYKGEQGTPRSEIQFVPLTRTVTMKLQVEDPNGYFLPNLRRENFAVYEDGVRQKTVSVEVEHSPVTAALLMEFGGRYHELNRALGLDVHEIGRQFLDVVGRNDKIAIFKYDGKLDTLLDFNQGRELADKAFDDLGTPEFSELNFYDSLLDALNRMRDLSGRKAINVVSSGLDTFSKATYEQVLQAAKDSSIPIYAIGLVRLIQREIAAYGSTAPFARIDWNAGQKRLENLAKVSGGRAYVLESDIQAPAIYDDIMENLRLRYVVTYVSSNTATAGPPRKIRVDLIDPKTGEALKIRDSTGKVISSKVFIQESYIPTAVTGD